MTGTTYYTSEGIRYGFTPTAEGDFVSVTTAQSNLGMFKIERFGDDPILPSGRLKRSAARHLLEGPKS